MIFLRLFLTFLEIGAVSFGGGYGMIPLVRSLTMANGWATSEEISQIIAISESTPGPIAVNMATYIGSRIGSLEYGVFGGLLGSTLATLGVVLPAFIVILIVSSVLSRFSNNKYVQAFLSGIKPVVVSLITVTGILLILESVLVGFTAILNGKESLAFSVPSLALIAGLIALKLVYKKLVKKEMSPILMILISGVVGIFVF